jgi:hypothetical protein
VRALALKRVSEGKLWVCLVDARVLDNEDRTWRILQNPVGSAPEQQSAKTGITVRTNHDEIGANLFGRIHYLFIRIPSSQDRFGLQAFAMNLFSDQRELRECLTLCCFHIILNRFVLEIESL